VVATLLVLVIWATLTGDGLMGALVAAAEVPVAWAVAAVLFVVIGWLPVKVTEPALVFVSATVGGLVLALAAVEGFTKVEPEAVVGLAP